MLTGKISSSWKRPASCKAHGQTIATFQHNISQHCWPSIWKLRPNDRNIWMQHIPTLLGTTSLHVACVRPPCFDVLWHVGYWKSSKCACPGATLLDGPGQTTTTSCDIHKCCVKNLTIFKFEPKTPNMSQIVATRRNRVAKRTQHVAPNNVAICCVEMLRSFGRGQIVKKFSAARRSKHQHSSRCLEM